MLQLHRADVAEKLAQRILLGEELQSSQIRNEAELESARSSRTKWNSYNIELLKRCFEPDTISDEYDQVSLYGSMMMNPSLGQMIESFRSSMQKKITNLESVRERLDLFPEPGDSSAQIAKTHLNQRPNSVFVVHGRDEAAKTRVARFIERLGLEAVILHEQPNRGQTIIEKFEQNAANVGFAVVLLTSDDIGAPKETPEAAKPRARQNVLLELGYFCASLGRHKVCVLYEEGVEIPTDYLGVVYTPFDGAEGWHLKLAKEMRAAGLNVDMNNAM